MKPLDAFAVALSLAVTLLFSYQLFAQGSGIAKAEIQVSGTAYLYSLEEDRTLSFTGPIGETSIRIMDGAVRVESSPCRDQICVNAGWLDSHPDWTACLPNRIILRVTGETNSADVDDVSF